MYNEEPAAQETLMEMVIEVGCTCASEFGCSSLCEADVDGEQVTVSDLLALLSNFAQPC